MSTDPFDPDNVAATLDAAGFPLAVRTGQRRSVCDRYDQLQPWQRAIADAVANGDRVSIAVPLRNGRTWDDRSVTRTTTSDHLERPCPRCGAELDPWESHVEHHPECGALGFMAQAGYGCDMSACTCPEVCADCCGECT
jgi:hypothetical protein